MAVVEEDFKGKWKDMIINDFDIKQIAESGECFRWNKINDNHYSGIIGENYCEVLQDGKNVEFLGISEEDVKYYFDLDRDYSKIKEFYRADDVLNKAIGFGEGIRILNQDKFETLISFIISANNNIPRIRKSVEKIANRYGKEIADGKFAFPTPKELQVATEEELKETGVGFRAKYIVNTCQAINNGFDLEKVAKLPTKECKKELMKLMGVGPKVADCVMLFSMGKIDAFPVDVWIKRIMEKLYIKEEMSLSQIQKYSEEKFGEYAGIAQQYLFFYARSL